MKKRVGDKGPRKAPQRQESAGQGGELHQVSDQTLTTNQGVPISDNQNSLKIGSRGPVLLEDFVLREKITHFDHERIPERVVHARGSAAHGYFEVTKPLKACKAAFLQKKGARTPVFVRFSTVAGSKGSRDLARDVRGFAVKFYTQEGNFDLVGNNMPVFFIQDAIKFPDLVHAAKPEPDREFPQAQTAHDTFWDFISLTPESFHMIMWTMSDRAIPRSLRMMEGFGVHTFRLIDNNGKSTFCKFHWRPILGAQSVVWDEALKISGADPDFHRRDLWETIDKGGVVEFDLSVQLFSEREANAFNFDVLDPTKLVPEELVPLTPVGRLVLDRNPDNFFAETEQVAFCVANVVPGIDFSNDPLMQGRLFSYLDTQLKRLGGPNFHQIPINAPKCPFANNQRDGHAQMAVPKGRVNYEPNSLDLAGPRETPTGFSSFVVQEDGEKMRVRPESFADHYSQARLFFRSQTSIEQDHIVAALIFELSKVQTPAVRERVVSHLANVDEGLTSRVAAGLGIGKVAPFKAATKPIDMAPSPALSIVAKSKPTLDGRCIGLLVTDGADSGLVDAVVKAATSAGAKVKIIAERIAGAKLANKKILPADERVEGGPSALFDHVAIIASDEGAKRLANMGAAQDFVKDAFAHLKVIGFSPNTNLLFQKAGLDAKALDEACVGLTKPTDATVYISRASRGKFWPREPAVRPLPPAEPTPQKGS
ncbi:MAG TPA: catalase [Rhodanobacteraceae bacterium]|nr:catalase [Rhodanobacteraceae bacterium]